MKGCSFFPESLLVLFLHAELPCEHARPQLHRWKSLQATCKHTTKKHTKPLGDPFEIKNYTVDTCTYINNIIHVYIIVYIYISCIYICISIYIYIYIYTVYTIHIGLGGNTQFKPSGVEMGDTLRNSKSISGNGSSPGHWGRNISRKVQAGVP
jgi:hypothetical protein